MAPAWKADFASTERRAQELFQSGKVLWGLDEKEQIFALYEVPYQPVTVLIAADGTVVERWSGLREEAELVTALENLVELGG